MALEDFRVRPDEISIVASVEKHIEFSPQPSHRAVLRIHFEFEYRPADFHAQAFLPGKNRLVLKTGHSDNMDVPVVHVVAYVVMPLNQYVGFLAALETFNRFLAGVTAGIA